MSPPDTVIVFDQNASSPSQPDTSNPIPEVPRPEIHPDFPMKGPYLTGPAPRGDPWDNCLQAVEKYDNDACKSWREEIDTLLVFVRGCLLFISSVETFHRLVCSPRLSPLSLSSLTSGCCRMQRTRRTNFYSIFRSSWPIPPFPPFPIHPPALLYPRMQSESIAFGSFQSQSVLPRG